MSPATIAQHDIPRLYARLAPAYDLFGLLAEARARRLCLERAAVKDGESILEVAVGTGLTFAELVRANPSGLVEGVDLTPAMLARAERRAAGLPGRHRLRVGDAHRLDFADASFDLVVNNYMFDLLPEADFLPILREFRRVLRPAGRLVLVNLASAGALNRVWDALYALDPRLVGGCRGVELSGPVAEAGFTGVRREVVHQLGIASELITARASQVAEVRS